MTEDEYARPATIADLKAAIQSLNENNVDCSLIGAQGVLAYLRALPAQAKEDGLPMKREELYDRASPRL